MIGRSRLLGMFAALGTAAAVLTAPTGAHASTDTSTIPAEAKVARIVDGHDKVVRVDKATYLARAAKAGVVLTAAERATINLAVACWSWDGWRLGENIWGADLWKSHHRMNWCGDWSWIRNHAYTERWGDTFWPGWNDKGLTQSGGRYGVGWNQYNSWTQRKFCYVEHFSCIQEANPYHNTTAFPNGATRWN